MRYVREEKIKVKAISLEYLTGRDGSESDVNRAYVGLSDARVVRVAGELMRSRGERLTLRIWTLAAVMASSM